MKKISRLLPTVTITLSLILACAGIAYAVTLPESDPGWAVFFTDGGTMESNFTTSNIDETINGMQPGDEAHFSITVGNKNREDADWYMESEIVRSMEDMSANSQTKGGAYTYRLSFTDSSGKETVYFDSNAVGGDEVNSAGEGLHKATNGQDGWFYLGKLAPGKNGKVDLVVALDGETQGNNYQDTLAELELRFAVELAENTERYVSTGGRGGVNTGDYSGIGVFIAICGIAGILLLIAAAYSAALRRKEGK